MCALIAQNLVIFGSVQGVWNVAIFIKQWCFLGYEENLNYNGWITSTNND